MSQDSGPKEAEDEPAASESIEVSKGAEDTEPAASAEEDAVEKPDDPMDEDSVSPATVFCIRLKQPRSNLQHKMSVPELCRNFSAVAWCGKLNAIACASETCARIPSSNANPPFWIPIHIVIPERPTECAVFNVTAGTGKSQFLKFAAKLSNRSVITTGLGSTSAGLTVTAVKDGGEWMLEAGALVLADGGICCIDEFDSMREHDRSTIHEAMEQQTISVAKAGLVTTLSTRTIVFGATNPKGQYDPDQSLSVNTTLSGPLLSRFDIVLVLLDTKNPEWDAVVSSHILAEGESDKGRRDEDLANIWPLSMLQRYIHFVKGYFRPVLTKEAEKVISSYYQLQRKSATHNAARTTVRMLESLIRLAQAHARLMFRNEVTRLDAITAILCIEASMTTSAIVDSVGNALHSNFAENPDQEYTKQERLILEKLRSIDDFPDINNRGGSCR